MMAPRTDRLLWQRVVLVTLAFATVTWALLWNVTAAWGYIRTRTENGIPVVWARVPIAYYIGRGGSSQIQDGSDIQAVKDAFLVWSGVDCARLSFLFSGLLDNPRVEYNAASVQNHVFWVQSPDRWPYPSDVLAATKLSWEPTTGEIFDADITFNDFAYQWSTSDTPSQKAHDVKNTAVHEIGHLLGLDHSEVPEATMHQQAPPGETQKRDLAADDRAGICDMYPKDGTSVTWVVVDADDGLTPCPSGTSDASNDLPPAQGCDAAGTIPAGFGLVLPIFFCLILCYARQRRFL